MREVTLKAYMGSYLVGSTSKVLSDTSSTSILCVYREAKASCTLINEPWHVISNNVAF